MWSLCKTLWFKIFNDYFPKLMGGYTTFTMNGCESTTEFHFVLILFFANPKLGISTSSPLLKPWL